MILNKNGNVNVDKTYLTYGNKSIETIRGITNPLDRLKGVNSIFVNGDVADRFAKPGLKSFAESSFPVITQEDINKKLTGVRSMFSAGTENILCNNEN